MSDQPNIVYVFTDQQAFNAMSCAGNRDLHTPAMDSLAASGVRFDTAYCTQPICTPSRSSMITGKMPHEMDTGENGRAIPEELVDQTIGNLLAGAGYECAYGGKWHVPSIEVPEQFGFENICGFDDNKLAGACLDFINRPHDKPFFLVASFDNPHNICEWARGQKLPWGPIDEPPVEECPSLPANFLPPPYEPSMIRLEQNAQPMIYPSTQFDADHWRRYRNAYFRLCEKVDAEIGRILEGLRTAGLEENTVVIFTSDHGDGHGCHRWNQKTVLYDEVVRIPMIVSHKGTSLGAHVDHSLVSNGLDLLPTLCDYAGIDPPRGLAGRSLRPLVEGRGGESWRDYLVTETRWFGGGSFGTQGRMVRTNDFKYNRYGAGMHREQLFHPATDPGEMINLANDKRYAAQLEWFRKTLLEWADETSDWFAQHN